MNILICGPRDFTDYKFLCRKLEKFVAGIKKVVAVLSGDQPPRVTPGVAKLAYKWAFQFHHWGKRICYLGKGFNYLLSPGKYVHKKKKFKPSIFEKRHQEMVDQSHSLVAFWDCEDEEVEDLIKRARVKGIPVKIFDLER